MLESIYYYYYTQIQKYLLTYWFLRKHYCLAIIYMNAELLNGIRTEVLFVMTLMEISDLQYMNTEMKML